MTPLPFRLSTADGAALGWRAYALLALLGLALFLPGISTLPPVDRDEPRFAQASKQMIESGNYLDISFQEEKRYKKPVGIYWLQSASALAFGQPPYDQLWAYRLPSLLGGLALLCIVAWGVTRLSGARAGMAAALAMASVLLLQFETRLAKTDAVLLAIIAAAQFIMAKAYCGRLGAAGAYGFWLLQAAGILVKGPIAPLFSLLTVLGLGASDRTLGWTRQLRPLGGMALCLALVTPWLAWIGQASGGAFYAESVAHDLLGKILEGQDRGKIPPGYHTLLLALWFMPQLMALIAGTRLCWRARHEAAARFALAWVALPWVFYEAIPTKLPHYVLPSYPALAWMAARWVGRDAAGLDGKWWRIGVNTQCAMLAGGLAVIMMLPWLTGGGRWGVTALCLGGIGLAVLQRRWFWRRRLAAMLCGAGVTFAGMVSLLGVILPQTGPYWITPQVRALYEAGRPCPLLSRLVSYGYNEPSMIFLAGTHSFIANGVNSAAAMLGGDACNVVMVRAQDEAAFLAALQLTGKPALAIGRVEGFNYNGGGWQRFVLYRQDGAVPATPERIAQGLWNGPFPFLHLRTAEMR